MAKDNRDFFKKKNQWSLIKDDLLRCYLPLYFQKLLVTNKPIVYVDCFAGKGEFEDGNPGSPLIALEIRDKCIEKSKQPHGRQPIESYFIELNYAAELRQNVSKYNNYNGEPKVISGKYEEHISSILRNKKGCNVFLYIDPYGIKALDTDLFDTFDACGLSTFEMLINFNSFGFFRDACRVMKVECNNDAAFQDLSELVEYEPTKVSPDSKQSSDMLTKIAGGDFWKDIVREYNNGKITGYQAEQKLSYEYKQQLRRRYTYVLDMPICLHAGQQPKYRMIHVSSHEQGCYYMAQNMLKRKKELFLNVQQEGQITLFDILNDVTSSAEGKSVTIQDIKDKLLEYLKSYSKEIGLTKMTAEFYTEYGLLCEMSMLHDALDALQQEGYIQIERTPALKINGLPRTFWEEKGGQTVLIRRIKV